MDSLREFSEIINESDVSFQRRANMLGQNLTNRGYDGVKVTVEIKIEASNPSGKHTRTISGAYTGYVAGNGPVSIGGRGASDGQGANGSGGPSGYVAPGMPSRSLAPPSSSRPSVWGSHTN